MRRHSASGQTTPGRADRCRACSSAARAVRLLDFAAQARRDFLLWAESALVLDTETVNDLPRIRALMEKYSDRSAEFADASLVALCERRRITRVASIDSDFTVYRMQDRRGFHNLFHAPG